MKRHFQVGSAAPAVIPTLSVEELAILDNENTSAELAMTSDADQLERVTEIAEVANDTTTVVNEMPVVGTVEQELVSAVADMAVAGTDGDASDILSVANVDGVVSTEGIASVLKSIWDAIVTTIKNLWVGIRSWLTTYFSKLEQNKKHAESLIEKLAGMKGKVAGKGMVDAVDIFGYSGSSILAMFANADTRNRDFMAYVPKTLETQFSLMEPMGEGIAEAFGKMKTVSGTADGAKLDTSDMEAAVAMLYDNLDKYCKKLGLESGKGEEMSHSLASTKVTVKGYSPKFASAENSMETKLANLTKVRFSADVSTEFSSNMRLSVKNDITPDKLSTMVEERLKFINELLKFKADDFVKLEACVTKVEKACDAMLSRIKQEDKAAVAIAKKWMPIATAYANWATQPATKLMSIAARHNSWFLSLYERAANNYVDA